MMPESHKEFLPKEGMWRVMPPEAVAEVVWNAYHDDARLHWYVPADLEAREREVVEDPTRARDEAIRNRKVD